MTTPSVPKERLGIAFGIRNALIITGASIGAIYLLSAMFG